jgi:phage repressor protein C with HTH and peptisase S24 domain
MPNDANSPHLTADREESAPMPTHFGSNVRHLLAVTNVQAARLAKAVGVSPATVSDWMSGKSRSVDGTNLVKVADFFRLRPEDLLQNDLSHIAREDLATYAMTPVGAQLTQVPVIASVEDTTEPGMHSEVDGQVIFPTADQRAYSLRVLGDSMRPRFKPGEFVIASPSASIEPGHEVIVKTSDGRTLVKVFDWRRAGLVQLSSVNESHPPMTLQAEALTMMHRIIGLVQADMYTPARPPFAPTAPGGL